MTLGPSALEQRFSVPPISLDRPGHQAGFGIRDAHFGPVIMLPPRHWNRLRRCCLVFGHIRDRIYPHSGRYSLSSDPGTDICQYPSRTGFPVHMSFCLPLCIFFPYYQRSASSRLWSSFSCLTCNLRLNAGKDGDRGKWLGKPGQIRGSIPHSHFISIPSILSSHNQLTSNVPDGSRVIPASHSVPIELTDRIQLTPSGLVL